MSAARESRTAAPVAARGERGLALAMVIAVTVIFTALIAAGLILVGGQRRVNDNQEAQLDALAMADAGLQQFLVNRAGLGFASKPPAAAESARVALPNGYADVVLTQIRPAVGQQAALYVVRSHGVDTRQAQSGTPAAERTVAQLASWRVGSMTVGAGWTSLTGLQKNGGSGTLSGTDGCGAKPAVAGVAVPSIPGYSQNGGSPVPTGSPPIDNLGTQDQADSSVKIDWNGIVNGNALTADVTIPPQSWPTFTAGSWPVILVKGDATIPTGQGLLVVTGSATISGSTTWNGIILVGNTLTSNGNNTVNGAVVTGLNVLLGQNPGVNSVGNGNKTFRYNSCDVAAATAGLGALIPLNNAQLDNWPTY